MKKSTPLFFFFIMTSVFAQSTTTGPITLTPGFTLQLDVDATNDMVTMTMSGPSTVWLGVSFDAQSMGNSNKDVVIYSNSGLRDYYLSGYSTPSQDTNNWTVISNTVSGSTRTIVASRATNTGQSTDYVFTTNTGNIPLLWAKGNGLSLSYHGNGNRGMAMGTFVLSTPDMVQQQFEVYPNPTVDLLNIKFPNNVQSAKVQVFDVLGKAVLQTNMTSAQSNLDTSSWTPGMYVLQIMTGDSVQTKRVIKQ